MYDLVLKNGSVFDGGELRGARRDIALKDGRIAAVRESIDPALAREVRDLSGAYVSAGWIDIHVHAYGGLALRNMQMVGVLQGATTVVDAGNFGTATFEDFAALTEDSIAEVYGYIHLDPVGIPYTALQNADYRGTRADALVDFIEQRSDRIRGLKLGALGDLAFHNLELAKSIAARAKVPYYMHIGEVSHFPAKHSLTQRAIGLLTEGDIATHIYTSDRGRIVGEDGRVVPEVVEAQKRGVLFDIGYGVGNFSYAIAERAMEQGVFPHIISSDQNSLCSAVRADLPAAMSRFFVLGMSLADIVHQVTVAPARALRVDDIGTLKEGSKADLTVFRIESGEHSLPDSDGVARSSDKVIVADHVYKNGRPHRCDVESIYHRDNFMMTFRPADEAGELELARDERAFLGALFSGLDTLAEWRGEAVHGVIDATIARTGFPRKKALHTLYRVMLSDRSFGFTPQIGAILARVGAEDLQPYREALALRN
jgi:dihydroorotase